MYTALPTVSLASATTSYAGRVNAATAAAATPVVIQRTALRRGGDKVRVRVAVTGIAGGAIISIVPYARLSPSESFGKLLQLPSNKVDAGEEALDVQPLTIQWTGNSTYFFELPAFPEMLFEVTRASGSGTSVVNISIDIPD